MGNEFKDLFGDWEPRDEGRPSGGDELPGEPENRAPRTLNEKEVKVVGVYEKPSAGPGMPSQTFVLLQDNSGRKVYIYIGRFEAFSISQSMEGEENERPLTYDLLALMLERLGATIDRVIVDDIWQETFYAKITLVHDGNSFDIDCRPSDAINIALRARAPIYMAEAVIEANQYDG